MLRSRRALVAVTLCFVTASACKQKRPSDALPTVTGNGVTSSQTRTLAPFTRLDVGGGLEVVVNVGKDAPLELSGDANLFEHVESKIVGGALTLDSDAVLKPAQALRLVVGVAHLDELGAAAAASVTVQGVKSDAFSVRTGGAAKVTVDGSATALAVGARTASHVDLSGFSAARARVVALDFTRIELGHLEQLEVTQHGFATVLYAGTPELTTHADRAQNVARRN